MKNFDKIFSAAILIGMTVCVIISTIAKFQAPDARKVLLCVSAFGALMGVASTVLSANGSIWNFLFGLLDVCIYSYILYDSKMPAQFLLHTLYFIPMEFVGFFQWRKRGAGSKTKVKAQRLHGWKWALYIVLFLAVLAVSFRVSEWSLEKAGESFNIKKIILDATITTANIVALVMMAFAYMEQWWLWTLVNISSITIWAFTLKSGTDYAIIPLVKYIFYLLNSINGIRIWLKLSKPEEEQLQI